MTGGQDIEVANFTVFTVYITVTPLFVSFVLYKTGHMSICWSHFN
jgi:hypothetical protein